ncbi:unnamed protein product [Rhizophagus irregularis]|nr:unnamed protein product [Rhizophagus irregularis]
MLQFSSGWLQGFKKHNGICQEKLQEEAASANEAAIIETLPLLHNKCANYPLELALKYGSQCVLLLLDNCTSHKVENLALPHVEIQFLPPNITSKIQPMDAGIIMSFKKYYCHYHICWLLE